MFRAKSILFEKLKRKPVVLGTWITMNTPEVSEIVSGLGLDIAVIDMEHAPLDVYDVELLLMGLKGSETLGVVRVPWNDFVTIKRVLDLGPHGILVPWVNNRRDAEEFIKACTYPPRGIRGMGPRRVVKYGLLDMKEYYKRYLDELVMMVQVETREAVENIGEIVETPGLAGVFVGPNDLSASLGVYGELDNSMFLDAMERIAKTSREKMPLVGIMVSPTPSGLELASRALEAGYNFLALASDFKVLVHGYKVFIDNILRML